MIKDQREIVHNLFLFYHHCHIRTPTFTARLAGEFIRQQQTDSFETSIMLGLNIAACAVSIILLSARVCELLKIIIVPRKQWSCF